MEILIVNNLIKADSTNKYLLHPFKINEVVRLHENQNPDTKISVKQFQHQFLRVIRRSNSGKWDEVYVASKKLFNPLKRNNND